MKMGEKGIQQGVQQGLQHVGEGVGEGCRVEMFWFSLPFLAHLSIGEADFASRPHSPNDEDVVVLGSGRWWGEGQQNQKLVSEIFWKTKEHKEQMKPDVDGLFMRSGFLNKEVLRS